MRQKTDADRYAREAKSYLRSSRLLRQLETAQPNTVKRWDNQNPIFFLLLHAAELALKAIGLARGHTNTNEHDIVRLLRQYSAPVDRSYFRQVYRTVRMSRCESVFEKWRHMESDTATAACQLELDKARSIPLHMVDNFKVLGALGKSEMTKLEFGKPQAQYWHSARYPRAGTTSYPDFEVCVIMVGGLIALADAKLKELK